MTVNLQHNIFVYTREPEDDYTASLANSIHFAIRQGEEELQPLNRNYGILFGEATVNDHNVIQEKGLIEPYLFHLKSGGFGIAAIRVDMEGKRDEESQGQIVLWTSEDLIHFNSVGLVKLHDHLFVKQVTCEYNEREQSYQFYWLGSDDQYYMNTMTSLTQLDSIGLPQRKLIGAEGVIEAEEMKHREGIAQKLSLPSIAEAPIHSGNMIAVDDRIWDAVQAYWMPVHHIGTQVPMKLQVSSSSELDEIKATAVYSDGSTALKKVKWNDDHIDFSKSGIYTVTGQAVQPSYSFPLASGYADPVILLWKEKYYFIATNDNKGDIGIYVREADTIEGLFAAGYNEKLILDLDEEKDFMQTFWAPEFHFIGEELYILFAVSGKQWGPQCHMMKLKKEGNILSANDWETPIRVQKADGTFLTRAGITLDMTYFKADGLSYVVWSYREHIGTPLDSGSMIYIATVDEQKPYILTSDPVLLTRPLLSWENMQGTINNEGPYPLITNDTVYITYSGANACGYTYALGLLSIPRGSNLLDASAWRKAPTPVLSYYSAGNVYGAGHNSFFTDQEGNTMIMYHGETEITKHGKRCSAMHRVHFNQQGVPRFDVVREMDLKAELSHLELEVEVVD